MKRLIFSLVMLSVVVAYAQPDIRGPIASPAPGVLDGVYVQEHIPTKKVVPYDFVREADVTWARRVWSFVDLREKFNHPLYYPLDDLQNGMWQKNTTRWSLWTIIRHHVMTGDLTIYSPFNPNWEQWVDGDMFKYPVVSNLPNGTYFTDKEFRERAFIYMGSEQVDPFAEPLKSYVYPDEDSLRENPETGFMEAVYPPSDTIWYTSKDIVQYRIKEDFFFDKERSVMDRRIIGIAPVVYSRDQNGNISGLRELFWLYFPECRYVFQNFFVQSRHNDAQRMSFDDLFWKRMFQSTIYKETNIYDRSVDSYRAGVDALLEAEKIKEKIANFEHDLWSF
ncbi:type IX secretion system ring subunit PorN/GldN [Crocinitomix catalasitica]|uniref:type IX secretion system ring protein PorN/GldN n=1 Tax=Crocinitomix catalasitica TaxID=184607 RepID=UPI000907BE3B|nr:gliding motility protein GldN [Crocinitomix catalasitica]